ncbi:MAG: nucleotidyltransferase family protein [Candidatus Magasanikbacteria bacterium]|nr:nucleotidyltransferase family protein [Candidatus Magasanikbacteria bacterium]
MNPSLQKIKKTASPFFKSYGVKRAAVFGSMARGKATRASDVDMLIEFKDKKSLLDLVALELDLAEQYGRKVDMVTYNSLHPLLRDRILKEQRIIYGQGS